MHIKWRLQNVSYFAQVSMRSFTKYVHDPSACVLFFRKYILWKFSVHVHFDIYQCTTFDRFLKDCGVCNSLESDFNHAYFYHNFTMFIYRVNVLIFTYLSYLK